MYENIVTQKFLAQNFANKVNANYGSLFNLQVKLKDSLMSSVSFRQAKDAELAWINGQIHFSSATSKGIVGLEGQEMEENTDLIPVLDAPSHTQVKCYV
jgi:hypothetical protein